MWQNTGKTRPDNAVEPEVGQESVWDYPRPPELIPDSRTVEVFDGDQKIASTTKSFRLCETASPPTFYLPIDAVRTECLAAAAGGSVCEWKGRAQYWALVEKPAEAVAWSYANPRSRYAKLAGYLAFYPAAVACFVDGERVRPQPGRFYGGWITADIVGPFKGEPGTGHW